MRAAAETVLIGGALDSEIAHLAPLAEAHRQKRAAAINTRIRNEKRKLEALAPRRAISFADRSIYIDASCLPVAAMGFSPIITKNRMALVEDVSLAPGGVLLAASPSEPTRNIKWIAILSGAAIVDTDYFVSGAAHGSCMSWKPAISTKRDIWLSADSVDSEPLLAALITWASRLPASKWTLRSATWDEGTYIQKQRKVSTLLGIVTAAEQGDVKFGNHNKTMLYDQFLKYVEKLDDPVSGYRDPAMPRSSRD